MSLTSRRRKPSSPDVLTFSPFVNKVRHCSTQTRHFAAKLLLAFISQVKKTFTVIWGKGKYDFTNLLQITFCFCRFLFCNIFVEYAHCGDERSAAMTRQVQRNPQRKLLSSSITIFLHHLLDDYCSDNALCSCLSSAALQLGHCQNLHCHVMSHHD